MPLRCLPLFMFLIHSASAQTCLVLSTAVVAPGGAADLELKLISGSDTPPASLQFTFSYPASLRSLTVNDGPAAAAADKTVMCNGDAAAYTCLAIGANAKPIPDGVIAKVTVALAPDAGSAEIQLTQTCGASGEGHYLPISSGNGVLTTANVSPDGRLRPPLKRISGTCNPRK